MPQPLFFCETAAKLRVSTEGMTQGPMSAGGSNFDEMFDGSGQTRPAYGEYGRWFDEQPAEFLKRKNREADDTFRRTGITFNVYGENEAEERLIPFDMVPRIITARRWRRDQRGSCGPRRSRHSFAGPRRRGWRGGALCRAMRWPSLRPRRCCPPAPASRKPPAPVRRREWSILEDGPLLSCLGIIAQEWLTRRKHLFPSDAWPTPEGLP